MTSSAIANKVGGRFTPSYPHTKCNDKSVKAKGLGYAPTKAGLGEIKVEFIDSGGARSVTKFVIIRFIGGPLGENTLRRP
jgi:hypothetical protein